jgi:C-terminal processing protease CtpA/Prc
MRVLVLIGAVLLAGCGPGMGSIGALLGKNHNDGRTVVREVPRDMEAARAGLEPGDEVLYIEGKDARAMTAEEVHQALVGPVGSTVRLTVLRNGHVLHITVRRGRLK